MDARLLGCLWYALLNPIGVQYCATSDTYGFLLLEAWGVRKITLLDSGRVSMSNPLRQSLYTLDDCLNGGEFKAVAAVKSLSRIFPAVVSIVYLF